MRSGLQTGLLFVASIAFALLLGEVVIRVLYPAVTPKHHFRPGIYAPDPSNPYRLRADYRGHFMEYERRVPTSTNRLAYRGPEETAARLEAALRIAAIGDSVAFGRGVDDDAHYPARLEARLRQRGIDAAVFNLAVPGYDTSSARRMLERHVERIDPHVIVLGWYRNDLHPAPGGLQVIDGYLIEDEAAYRRWRDRIDDRARPSALVNWLGVRLKLWKKSRSLQRRAAGQPRDRHERVARNVGEIHEIQDIAARRGAAFVLVVHPAHEEVLTAGLSAETVEALRSGVETAGRASFTSVLEMAPLWRGTRTGDLYLPGDRCHPSDAGHDSIARALAELPVFAGGSTPRSSAVSLPSS